ncbi:MAG: quinone-dependent dihydroorotate dehydrogenase [Leptospiraceae bacterium]|nr:quinone-dependent dihydroorotate dehydrogenase [Leptospiraceae bacterium]
MYSLLKPLLFQMDPERAHHLITGSLAALHRLPGSGALIRAQYKTTSPRLRQQLCGMQFDNPVGMAAGFDKSGALYPLLGDLGFGFVESGTFTALAQPGNPRPRLFRLPAQKALINRMGFNNAGAAAVRRLIRRQKRTIPRGLNLGKSKVAPLEDAVADYCASLALLADQADYIAINVSSPNTPGLRQLQAGSALKELLVAIQDQLRELARKQSEPARPLFVKLAPDLSNAELDELVDLAVQLQLDGLILTNTTLDHSRVAPERDTQGGLSGPLLHNRALECVRRASVRSAGRLILIGVGGITTAADAIERLAAGASLLQFYTAYIYEGPGLPRRLNRGIDQFMQQNGLQQISDLIGLEHRDPQRWQLIRPGGEAAGLIQQHA